MTDRTTWAVQNTDAPEWEVGPDFLCIYVNGERVAEIQLDAFPALIADLSTAIRKFEWKPK